MTYGESNISGSFPPAEGLAYCIPSFIIHLHEYLSGLSLSNVRRATCVRGFLETHYLYRKFSGLLPGCCPSGCILSLIVIKGPIEIYFQAGRIDPCLWNFGKNMALHF